MHYRGTKFRAPRSRLSRFFVLPAVAWRLRRLGWLRRYLHSLRQHVGPAAAPAADVNDSMATQPRQTQSARRPD